MMPLTVSTLEEENIIRRIVGNQEAKKHLEDLGFVAGTPVRVVNRLGGNVIVNVRNSRVAVSEEMALRIMV